MNASVECVCCRGIVIILAKIDRQGDFVLSASQSIEDLNLNASTCRPSSCIYVFPISTRIWGYMSKLEYGVT